MLLGSQCRDRVTSIKSPGEENYSSAPSEFAMVSTEPCRRDTGLYMGDDTTSASVASGAILEYTTRRSSRTNSTK